MFDHASALAKNHKFCHTPKAKSAPSTKSEKKNGGRTCARSSPPRGIVSREDMELFSVDRGDGMSSPTCRYYHLQKIETPID